ncbi:MAG: T9SS type A sorting domain-containing protein [Saprospiraceae bacterium]
MRFAIPIVPEMKTVLSSHLVYVSSLNTTIIKKNAFQVNMLLLGLIFLTYGFWLSAQAPVHSQPQFFSVYPNPANDRLVIHVETGSNTPTNCRVKMLTSTGELVVDEKGSNVLASSDMTFSTRSLHPGVYWVPISLDSGRLVII